MAQTQNIPAPSGLIAKPWGSQGRFKENLFVPIRLGLALLVIFSHSYPIVLGDELSEPLIRLTGYQSIGDCAVEMFLAISGFLIASSWDSSKSAWNFMLKRVLRIYPAFIVLMMLQAFVLAPLAAKEPFTGYSLKQLALIAVETIDLVGYGFPYGGLLTTFPNNPFPHEMNGSLWTIRYEFVCYFLLALGAGFRKPKWLALGFAAMLLVYLSGWLPPWHKFLTAAFGAITLLPRLVTFFLAGALFYRLRDRIPHDGKIALGALIALVIAAISYPTVLRLLLPTAGVYLLFWFAYHPRLMSLPKLHKCDLSYGTYLYAFPIQQSLMLWLAPHIVMTPWKLAMLATLCTLPIAALSWYAIEKPFLSLKSRKKLSVAAEQA
jgi:peptidoglycan/LPS O-acetylase OafA/YrhL